MAETITKLDGSFIATVYDYNKDTRDIEVFIPKLMPMVPEGQKQRTSITNLGNRTVSIKYNKQLTLASTISVPAYNCDVAMPSKSSKVLVEFYDSDFELRFWKKFNPSFLSDVIEEERYPRHFYLRVNDKKIPVNLDDEIVLNFPGYDVAYVNNGKEKIVNLIQNESLDERINALSILIGNGEYKESVSNTGETNTIEANGMMKSIYESENKIDDLESLAKVLTEKVLSNIKNSSDLASSLETTKESLEIAKTDLNNNTTSIKSNTTKISKLEKTIETLTDKITALEAKNKEN